MLSKFATRREFLNCTKLSLLFLLSSCSNLPNKVKIVLQNSFYPESFKETIPKDWKQEKINLESIQLQKNRNAILNSDFTLINEKYNIKLLGLASPLNFKSSPYKELKDYEIGHVKEGVGAGGISILAFLSGFKNHEIVSLCQQNLEMMKGLGQISLEKDC